MWDTLVAGIHRDRVGKENVIRDVPLSIFFNNGDSWTSGPKHWDISRCCRCHHFPSPWSHIITKIFETAHATSERYILHCRALSIRATRSTPNDAFQPEDRREETKRMVTRKGAKKRKKRDPCVEESSKDLTLCWRFHVILIHVVSGYPGGEKYLKRLHDSSSMNYV